MSKTLAFLHTIPSLVGPFAKLAKTALPTDIKTFHMVDEMLSMLANDQGHLTPFLYRRVTAHAIAAEQAGATALQLTCSTISPCADVIRFMVGIPVLKIDQPMVDKAIHMGRRIAVVATASTALKAVSDLVVSRARVASKDVQVTPVLQEEVYDALVSGDHGVADRVLVDTVIGLLPDNDVILLAQATMAHVVDMIPAEQQTTPILASPYLALEHARVVLDNMPI